MEGTTAQNILFIVNDGPYGNERAYNALRQALDLVKRPDVVVRVFLMGDGVLCARRGQNTPAGYYNIERMLKSLARRLCADSFQSLSSLDGNKALQKQLPRQRQSKV